MITAIVVILVMCRPFEIYEKFVGIAHCDNFKLLMFS